jgi:Flp pilus assembly pilin Flp
VLPGQVAVTDDLPGRTSAYGGIRTMDAIQLEIGHTHPFAGSEAGQALVEYALILALVSLTAIGLTPVGQWLATRFADLAAAIAG